MVFSQEIPVVLSHSTQVIMIPMGKSENLLDTLLSNKEDIAKIIHACGGTEVRVVGSVARREDTENSDIDLVVTLDENARLSDLQDMRRALQRYLRRGVDVITMASVVDPVNHFPAHRREQLLSEAVRL